MLKNKRETKKIIHIHTPHEPAKANFVEFDSDGDFLFAISTERENVSDWILDSGCTYHICPHKDWFSTYD